MDSAGSSVGPVLPKEFFFGWDLLYKTIEKTVNKKTDVLVALVHFMLVKHSNFRCVGVGEDKTLTEDEVGSELLPDAWNDNDRRYALRYAFDNQLFLLLGHLSEDTLIINLLDVKSKKVSNIGLDPENLVKKLKGPLTEMIPDVSTLANRFGNELVNPVFSGNKKEVTTQTTQSREENPDPLRIGPPMRPMPLGQFVPAGIEPRPFGFPDVGRGDLDPLGRFGPGNLLTMPPRPNFAGQPRFDPFGPPDVNLPGRPNPDHMRPPYDDYYL